MTRSRSPACGGARCYRRCRNDRPDCPYAAFFIRNASSGTFSFTTDFLATVTARIGYAFNRNLIYFKGGAAWAQSKYNLSGGTRRCGDMIASSESDIDIL
jgi:hypothetical protein